MRVDRKINLSDRLQRAILLEELSTAKGWHNVSLSPARPKATHPQHGYYRCVVCPLAKIWLNDTQGANDNGEDFDEKSAHEWLKNHLRGIPVMNKTTGEYLGTVTKSHAEYTVAEMASFIDDVVELLTKCGVNVPPPTKDYAESAA